MAVKILWIFKDLLTFGRSPLPDYISPYQVQEKKYAVGPVCEGITSGGTRERCHFTLPPELRLAHLYLLPKVLGSMIVSTDLEISK